MNLLVINVSVWPVLYSYCILDMEQVDPGLVYLQKSLDTLVVAGKVEQSEADHYRAALTAAPAVGKPVISGNMFKISFNKIK